MTTATRCSSLCSAISTADELKVNAKGIDNMSSDRSQVARLASCPAGRGKRMLSKLEWIKYNTITNMRKLFFIAAMAMVCIACGKKAENKNEASTSVVETVAEKPVVYMTKDISPEGLVKVYEALGVVPKGKVAVKISTGEPGGKNFLQPSLIKDLVVKVNGTIVECNTAYKGPRFETESHLKVFKDHGFTAIAPIDLLDGEAEVKIPVQDTTHIKYNIVGANMLNYDWMVNLAHFKGHAMGGFGGVLKNQSIGVASANGKAYIHSAGVIAEKEKIWQHTAEQDKFIECMAVAAQSVHDYFEGRVIYINVMNNLSVDCDCDNSPADPEMNDVGILASMDPVALDQACVDLVFNYPSTEDDNAAPLIERINSRHGIHILEHAAKIGLGSRVYELRSIDK